MEGFNYRSKILEGFIFRGCNYSLVNHDCHGGRGDVGMAMVLRPADTNYTVLMELSNCITKTMSRRWGCSDSDFVIVYGPVSSIRWTGESVGGRI